MQVMLGAVLRMFTLLCYDCVPGVKIVFVRPGMLLRSLLVLLQQMSRHADHVASGVACRKALR